VRVVLDRCGDLPLAAFRTGEIILEDGGRKGVLYILASGSVEIVKDDTQINVVTEPGAFLGEVAVLLDQPHTATVRALEACACRVVEDPQAFVAEHPEVGIELARLLARRLHYLTTYLVDVKRQYAGSDHLGMVDEVLETLVHHQEPEAVPGSDRCPEPDPTVE